jgi:hypothetical protein
VNVAVGDNVTDGVMVAVAVGGAGVAVTVGGRGVSVGVTVGESRGKLEIWPVSVTTLSEIQQFFSLSSWINHQLSSPSTTPETSGIAPSTRYPATGKSTPGSTRQTAFVFTKREGGTGEGVTVNVAVGSNIAVVVAVAVAVGGTVVSVSVGGISVSENRGSVLDGETVGSTAAGNAQLANNTDSNIKSILERRKLTHIFFFSPLVDKKRTLFLMTDLNSSLFTLFAILYSAS